jgi:NAD(P)-dependent dehydrogenase (short-subunit alcohol dehydrogenase family)
VNGRAHAEGPQPAEVVAGAIREGGGEAVANLEAVEAEGAGARMVEHALDLWGRLDVLICNAGIGPSKMFHRMSLAEVRQIVEINLIGTLAPLHAALGPMRAAGYGRILVNTSNAGVFGGVGFAAYSATKSAMHGFVASIADESRPKGVQVNAILPFADTEMAHAALSNDALPAGTAARMPTSVVASAVIWLVSHGCPLSGAIVIAGGRAFRRAKMVQGRGIELSDATPEKLAERASQIASTDELILYESTPEMLRDLAEVAIEP